jgi:hypothetical protein
MESQMREDGFEKMMRMISREFLPQTRRLEREPEEGVGSFPASSAAFSVRSALRQNVQLVTHASPISPSEVDHANASVATLR